MSTGQGESLMTGPVETAPASSDMLEERDFRAKEIEGLSQGQIVRRRFMHHRGAVVSLVALVLVILLAATSIGWGPIPHWWKWSYAVTLAAKPNQEPTLVVPWLSGGGFRFALGDFPFGADQLGYDNFSRVMRGIQQTLIVIVIMGILTTLIGTVLGAVAGYYRGWIESIIMRFTDLMITLPIILVTAVPGYVFGAHGVLVVGGCLGLLSWTGLARLVRAEFLSLREREFVDAAKVAGASDMRIIFKHILPNAVGVIVVNMTLVMSGGSLAEAALSGLGVGIQGAVWSRWWRSSRCHADLELPDGDAVRPTVAVHLAGRVHHHHRAVPELRR